ncbi:inner membrane protein [Schizosaccharomyces cryophilus OY26]|uniref:Sensitive to high expression protein 9, mitochondrial n=1 Tax=Schizosaccharomyces cryophilus (strain OY26 / ATCC MYA-4695 / CBS 11777 / NBRC 106824 / NRRL Y48691) TaxID=653667 RepID=S9W398_SCHCR|nr:inner membrane protein [Schizosaccharomyces cryophilus OY26]EPY52420.1 inner membrane protein [Schizosaccharomyces cryophilus OY26]
MKVNWNGLTNAFRQFSFKLSSVRPGREAFSFREAMLRASRRLNEFTGYTSIESLKKTVVLREQQLKDLRKVANEARKAYLEAVERRSSSQREVNELIQRRSSWSSADLERFTRLYREDYSNKENETRLQENVESTEEKIEDAQNGLVQSILSRYHEEQVWSDKIRQTSTWGTWGLMGINVILFIVVQLILEPKRRRRWVHESMEFVENENKDKMEFQIQKLNELEEKISEDVAKYGLLSSQNSSKATSDTSSKPSAFFQSLQQIPSLNFSSFKAFTDSIKDIVRYIFSPSLVVQITHKQLSMLLTECFFTGGTILCSVLLLFRLSKH